jgi:predicted dienelactone hydrolase
VGVRPGGLDVGPSWEDAAVRVRTLRSRLENSLFIAVIFTAVCTSSAVAGSGPVDPPDELGPYAVGHTTFDLVDANRDDRPLEIQAWYPADPADAVGENTLYTLVEDVFFLPSENAFDDLPVLDRFFMPLIVFSHGHGGINIQSVRLMEALASHGFVVVAPNHTGDTTFDESATFEESAVDRPLDISFLIDVMIDRTFDFGDPFFLRINPAAIGVAGHSFGGYTALAMAAGYGGGGVAPDPRVKAIFPIAAVADFFTDEELASIEIPTLLLHGTEDEVVPIEPNTIRAFDLISSPFLYRVDIEGANHYHFANICDIGNALIAAGIPPALWPLPIIGAGALVEPYAKTCTPDAFPVEEATRLQNLYAVAFFRRHLRLDKGYAEFLTESYAEVNEPFATLFRGGGSFCGLGFEVALVLPALMALRRRKLRARP